MSVQQYRDMNNTGIIILAAGGSTRFGTAKQLLHFNGKTLLQHAIDEAVGAGAEPIVVITGANADKISKNINHEQVQVVFNEGWEKGMASSIVAGMHAGINYNKDIENIIIAVSDQPFVSSSLFKELYKTHEEGIRHIIACAYADTVGTPVLFTRKYFDDLLSLQGDEGAKKILLANTDDVATIDFPQGKVDIDTQKDYEELLDKQKHVL
jgi:molybdenum cofactor cytidylyltransferase